MKTIGLLGGMSWESSLEYYRAINQGIKHAKGGLHSAKIVMHSVDFAQIAQLQSQGDWAATADILIKAAQGLQQAGADCILICTNTMHLVAPQIQCAIDVPLLHIADATGPVLVADKVTTVALLGTQFTMEQDFYKGYLSEHYALKVITPNQTDRKIVHDVIYQELCLGEINPSSKAQYIRIIDDLASAGAQGVILGCTEIALLINQADTKVALYDTTALHAQSAVQFALKL